MRLGAIDIETLGGGWVGEEALAIAVCAALAADDLVDGLSIAVNHSGDTDSTGAICVDVLGAAHGVTAVPDDLLAELEARDVIEQIADDLCGWFWGEDGGFRRSPDGWDDRYPGF